MTPMCPDCKRTDAVKKDYCFRCQRPAILPGRIVCVGYGYMQYEAFVRNVLLSEDRYEFGSVFPVTSPTTTREQPANVSVIHSS